MAILCICRAVRVRWIDMSLFLSKLYSISKILRFLDITLVLLTDTPLLEYMLKILVYVGFNLPHVKLTITRVGCLPVFACCQLQVNDKMMEKL